MTNAIGTDEGPSVEERIAWARTALEAHGSDLAEDLIADLLHLAESQGADTAQVLERAQAYYKAERETG